MVRSGGGGGGSKVGRFGFEVFRSSFSSSLQKFGEGIDSISHDLSHKFSPYSGDFVIAYTCIFYFLGTFLNLIKTEIEAVMEGEKLMPLCNISPHTFRYDHRASYIRIIPDQENCSI